MSIRQGSNIISYTKVIAPDTIEAINNTSASINANDKVWFNKVEKNYSFTSTSGTNELESNPLRLVSSASSGSLSALISNTGTSKASSSIEVCTKYKINRIPDSDVYTCSVFGDSSLSLATGSYNGVIYTIRTGGFAQWGIGNNLSSAVSGLSSKLGVWIWDKITLTTSGSQVTFLTQNSTDGSTWTTESNYSMSFNIANNLIDNLIRFGINTSVNSAFEFELDLEETYVSVDGAIAWKASDEYYNIVDFSNVTQNSYTGIAQEYINVNETGTVRTALTKEYETQDCVITLFDWTTKRMITEHLPVLIEMYDSVGNKLGEKTVTTGTSDESIAYKFTLENNFSYFTMTMLDPRYVFRNNTQWTWSTLKQVSGGLYNIHVLEV